MISADAKKQLEQVAEELLDQESQHFSEIDLVELGRHLGVTMWLATFRDSRVLSVLNRSEASICLSSDVEPEGLRFGIAHQLGHWVLHKGNDIQYMPTTQSDRIEPTTK